MSKTRIVFDTNAIVSAVLIKQSVVRRAFDKVLREGQLLQSITTIEELYDVLARKKFDKYITVDDRLRFVERVVSVAELVEVTVTINDCRDPKDNKFLELAVSGKADIIISGDKDLGDLNPFRGISILKPADYLNT